MYFSRLLICSVVNLFSVCISHAQPESLAQIAKKLDSHIVEYVEKGKFRGAVLVAKQGQIIHSGAYGFADENKRLLNQLDTQFLIGSTTKSFTAVTLMQFAENGLVDLHVPIAAYLPKINKRLSQKLTLHLLLKMQSGLPNHLRRLVDLETKDIPSAEILEIINRSSLSFEPGSRYAYSNLNYHLIAIVLENVSGKSFSEILQERTFGPLKMNNSGIERLSNIPERRAKGYESSHSRISQAKDNIVSYALGSGDIYSTVEHLFKWDQALYGSEYLSDNSKNRLFAGENREFGFYGYGFRVREYQRGAGAGKAGKLVRHGGTMIGFTANLHRYLDDKVTVIVLGNLRPFPIRDLTFQLKEITLGFEPGKRSRSDIE